MPKERPEISIFDPKGDIASKFDFYIKIVIGILIVAMINMLLMVGGIVFQAWHFNSAVYKEYSEKINTLDIVQQSNKTNQQIIIDQQKQILDLSKKK